MCQLDCCPAKHVVGVERTENEVKSLLLSFPHHPFSCTQAVCSAIAVLLHYLFLVVFMWMLMEGVVLYVALVKVFVKYYKRYIATFTVASYGQLVPKNCTKSDIVDLSLLQVFH